MITEYPETHQVGMISLENIPKDMIEERMIEGDFGIQIASDGRVWICVDGVAFIRFKPSGLYRV